MKWILDIPYLLIQSVVRNISCCSKMLIFLLIILYYSRWRMKATHQKVNIRTNQRPKKEIRLKERVNSYPAEKKKKTEYQRLWKASELLTACSNQATKDECQNFGNMLATKLRNYDTMRCAIKNEIMGILLNAQKRFYECHHHTQLQSIKPPQSNLQNVPSKYQSSSAQFSFSFPFSKTFSITIQSVQ